NHPMLMNLL
nr:Chain C, SRC1 [Homo sapiens]